METQNALLVRKISRRPLSVAFTPPHQCISDTAFVVLASLATDLYPGDMSSYRSGNSDSWWVWMDLFSHALIASGVIGVVYV